MTAFAVFLLSFFVGTRRKAVLSVGCRSPPFNLKFFKIFRLEVHSMAYNKAKEEKKWRLWKEAEEKQLRSLGVSEDTIEKLHVHDWAIFNSDRRYYQRMQESGTYLEEVAEDTTPPEVKTVEDFLDSIEKQKPIGATRRMIIFMAAGHLQEKKGFFYMVLSYPDITGKRKTKWFPTGLSITMPLFTGH